MLDEGKLAAAVEDALRFVGSGEDKLVRLLEYITRLESDSKWAPAEISAFHTRVSQALAKPKPDLGFRE
jgi:hypothetical protein